MFKDKNFGLEEIFSKIEKQQKKATLTIILDVVIVTLVIISIIQIQ